MSAHIEKGAKEPNISAAASEILHPIQQHRTGQSEGRTRDDDADGRNGKAQRKDILLLVVAIARRKDTDTGAE